MPEPFNLEELKISAVPQLKFDTDEYYLEVLREKFGGVVLERCLSICKEYDCYLDDSKIIRKLVQCKVAHSEEQARELLCECSALILI